MGDEGDGQMGANRKRMLFSRRADTVGDGYDRQKQGAKRKNMIVDRTKSGHEYLEGKCTAHKE